jgi:uncharacterized protein
MTNPVITDTILISGGTGLIGRYLGKKLNEKGYHVAILSRSSKHDSEIPVYFWNPDQYEIDQEAITRADYIIHLAGAGIGEKRWTKSRRQLIVDSRVKTGQLFFNAIQDNRKKLKAFISSSAVGYYGAITSDKIFNETDPPSGDFLGETCRQWEATADRFEELGIRTVKIRTGVVLTRHDGALAKMTFPVKMGMGAAIGKGTQYLPWIHIEDLCGMYIKAVEDLKMTGAYNAVAPDHKTNKEFMKSLASMLRKPFWLPGIPAIVMKILFSEMSAILLKGSRVSSDKIRASGFSFQFPTLESALTDLLEVK